MWRAYQKIHRFTDVIAYFSTQQWLFHNNNIQNLWKKLSPQDKILFKFDMSLVDWEVFMFTMIKGMMLYTMGDTYVQLEESSARYRRYGLSVERCDVFTVMIQLQL
jgi:fatty acyl-CoA reductase